MLASAFPDDCLGTEPQATHGPHAALSLRAGLADPACQVGFADRFAGERVGREWGERGHLSTVNVLQCAPIAWRNSDDR